MTVEGNLSSDEPTYLDLAAQNKSGSEVANQTAAPSSEETQEDATEENLSDTTADTSTSESDDPEEPADLDAAKEVLAKVRKQLKDAQSEVGRHGQEKGDLRQEVARMRAELDVMKAPPEEALSLKDMMAKHPVLSKLPEANREALAEMVDMVTDYKLERSKPVRELKDQVGNIHEMQMREKFNEEIKQAKENVGEDLLQKHNARISQFMQQNNFNITVESALAAVAPQEYAEALIRRKNAKAKDRLAERAGLPRTSGGGDTTPVRRRVPATDNASYFKEAMAANLKKYGGADGQ
ncbi:MAG: hypothetical protein IPL86_16975 [Flavobacteriales bacterium]|nr:hypothetical protein [Flavobacteriales bacterium]